MKKLAVILVVVMLAGQVFAWDLFGGIKDLFARVQYTGFHFGFHLARQTIYTGQCLFNGVNFLSQNPVRMAHTAICPVSALVYPEIRGGIADWGLNIGYSTAGWLHTMLNWPPKRLEP